MAFVYRAARHIEPDHPEGSKDFLDNLYEELDREDRPRPVRPKMKKVVFYKQFNKHVSPDPATYSIPSQFQAARPKPPPVPPSKLRTMDPQPGPGDYTPLDSSIQLQGKPKPKPKYQSKAYQQIIKQNSLKKVASIPSRNSNAYQYQSREHNKGVEEDSIGPGMHYLDSTFEQSKALNQSSVFISASKRMLMGKPVSQAGPGSYFNELPKQKPRLRYALLKRPISASSSGSDEQEYLPNATPGPGYYSSSRLFDQYRGKGPIFVAKSQPSQIDETPGPGTYNCTHRHDLRVQKISFNTSDPRFKAKPVISPAPNRYNIQVGIAQKLKKIRINKPQKKEQDLSVVIVQEIQIEPSQQPYPTQDIGNWNFISKDEKFPGPGQYNPPSKSNLRNESLIKPGVVFGSSQPSSHFELTLEQPQPNTDFYKNYAQGGPKSTFPKQQYFKEKVEDKKLKLQLRPSWDIKTFNQLFQKGHVQPIPPPASKTKTNGLSTIKPKAGSPSSSMDSAFYEASMLMD